MPIVETRARLEYVNNMRRAAVVLLVAFAVAPSGAQEKVRSSSEIRDRINKAWDERIERILRARIEADCKAETKKAYAAIRFNKRRIFLAECIRKAIAPTAVPAHQIN